MSDICITHGLKFLKARHLVLFDIPSLDLQRKHSYSAMKRRDNTFLKNALEGSFTKAPATVGEGVFLPLYPL